MRDRSLVDKGDSHTETSGKKFLFWLGFGSSWSLSILRAAVVLHLLLQGAAVEAEEKTLAKENQGRSSTPSIAAPAVPFEFGNVIAGTTVTADFLLRNAGTGRLTLEDPKSSCGCTKGTIEKHVLAPDEATTAHVKFNTEGYKGPQSRKVYIHSNDPVRPDVELSLEGEVTPLFSKKGELVLSKTTEFRARCELDLIKRINSASPEISITGITDPEGSLVASVTPIESESQTVRRYSIEVRLASGGSAGDIGAREGLRRLQVQTNVKLPAPLPLYAYIQDAIPLVFSPNSLRLCARDFQGQAVIERTIKVAAAKGEDLRIIDVKSTEDVTATWAQEQGGATITLKIAPRDLTMDGCLERTQLVVTALCAGKEVKGEILVLRY